MHIRPFKSSKQALQWIADNCEKCKSKCDYYLNIKLGFITNEINMATVNYIGFTSMSDDKTECVLNDVCSKGSNIIIKPKYKSKRK